MPLTLSRFPGESVMIGDLVEVKVSAMRNGMVRLSIDAPPSIMILRRELWQPRKRAFEPDLDAIYAMQPDHDICVSGMDCPGLANMSDDLLRVIIKESRRVLDSRNLDRQAIAG